MLFLCLASCLSRSARCRADWATQACPVESKDYINMLQLQRTSVRQTQYIKHLRVYRMHKFKAALINICMLPMDTVMSWENYHPAQQFLQLYGEKVQISAMYAAHSSRHKLAGEQSVPDIYSSFFNRVNIRHLYMHQVDTNTTPNEWLIHNKLLFDKTSPSCLWDLFLVWFIYFFQKTLPETAGNAFIGDYFQMLIN